MRDINLLVIHGAATPPSMDIGRDEIDRWHRAKGWLGIGYHHVIRRNGLVEQGRPVEETGAHAYGYNRNSIGICMIGGVSEDDHTVAEDNYTIEQYKALKQLTGHLVEDYDLSVIGHNEVSSKECPCFDVQRFLAIAGLDGKVLPFGD